MPELKVWIIMMHIFVGTGPHADVWAITGATAVYADSHECYRDIQNNFPEYLQRDMDCKPLVVLR